VLTPNVWIGRKLTDAEAAAAIKDGVTAVLDLTCESSECKPFLAIRYCHLPIMDLTAPTPEHFARALRFIQEYSPAGVVYIHCKAGYSRTAAIALAWLLSSEQGMTMEQAVAQVRKVRPKVVIRPEILQAIRAFSG
jgi:protein-tyrosine phosphatase